MLNEFYIPEIHRKSKFIKNIIPQNLMKNNSFQLLNNISIPQNNIKIKKGYKSGKSNNSISYKHINFNQNLEEVPAIDPATEPCGKNSISKIISFKNDKSNIIININNRKKSYKNKKAIINNKISKYKKYKNFNTINSKSAIVKKKHKIKNITINSLFLVLNENKNKHKKK